MPFSSILLDFIDNIYNAILIKFAIASFFQRIFFKTIIVELLLNGPYFNMKEKEVTRIVSSAI